MSIEGQDEPRAPAGTVIEGREPASKSIWWLLALALIAAIALLRHEQITEWFGLQAESLLSAAPPPASPRRETRVQAEATPVRVRTDKVPPAAPEMPSATAAPVPEAPPVVEEANKPLPKIRPLYPETPAAVPQAATGPQGRAGLVEAMRAGTLRTASRSDISRWQSSYASAHGRSPGKTFDERLQTIDAYAVKGDFTIPGGLYGANAVVFVLDRGVPYPRGDAGHSVILDIASGSCIGVVCGSMLPER